MADPSASSPITRRHALAVAGTVAAAVASGAIGASHEGEARGAAAKSPRLPVVYMPHGGGPWPFVDLGSFVAPGESEALSGYLRSVGDSLKPKAILVVSAHWEAAVPTVMTAERPPLYFDYYGFPPESYTLTWPAAGNPRLAARTRELLGAAGFASAESSDRGYDHGTFVPLKVAYPAADVPTVQLSLKSGLDPAEHLAMGRALAPLRDEGILIVGSGMSYHNMRGFGGAGAAVSETFDAWLRETVVLAAAERDARLRAWASAPSARQAHPREEHLLPLMVIAGAAGEDRGRVAWGGTFGRVRISAHHFG
jgi:aromatic ring-opening dioxygenase catalytic subunit (LigB family)